VKVGFSDRYGASQRA